MQWGAGGHELCTGEGYSHCNLTSVLRTALGAGSDHLHFVAGKTGAQEGCVPPGSRGLARFVAGCRLVEEGRSTEGAFAALILSYCAMLRYHHSRVRVACASVHLSGSGQQAFLFILLPGDLSPSLTLPSGRLSSLLHSFCIIICWPSGMGRLLSPRAISRPGFPLGPGGAEKS